jgi:uncharacterized caspase-like protein
MASYIVSQVRPQFSGGFVAQLGQILILFLLLIPFPGLAFAGHGKHYALVIGVERFERARDLRNPGRDAQAVAARLSELGYALHGDGVHLNTTRQEMLTLMRDFAFHLPEGATAVVFLAGHGLSEGGDTFLIPADDAGLRTRADLADHAVALRSLTGRLAARPGVNAIVLVDACSANGLRGEGAGSGGAGDLVTSDSGSMSLIYAAAPGQIASDGIGNNSPFTQALLHALETPQEPLEALFRRLAGHLNTAAAGAQTPWVQTPWIMRSYGDIGPVYLSDR